MKTSKTRAKIEKNIIMKNIMKTFAKAEDWGAGAGVVQAGGAVRGPRLGESAMRKDCSQYSQVAMEPTVLMSRVDAPQAGQSNN